MVSDFKTLFLRQSYLDSYEEYERSLTQKAYMCWDYVVLTSSNEAQAENFRRQINRRLENGLLPKKTEYVVVPDPDGKRVGSGGATLNVIKYIKEKYGINSFKGKKILLIHSGGYSVRIPQYSVCGKLFSPVPREIPGGRRSTVFDEFIISMTGVPSRISEGMLVLSGDVLLLFNPLQIDFYSKGAAAFSFKADTATGKNHGVYLRDKNGNVGEFLHKQSEEKLIESGAADSSGNIDIDTGAVIFDGDILDSLYKMVEKKEDFEKFANENVRLSFYADFIYPFGTLSSEQSYLSQMPEVKFSTELEYCRKKLWNLLHRYTMKLIRFSPALFIHFGTSREYRSLVADKIESYRFLNWSNQIITNRSDSDFSAGNSYISKDSSVGKGTYIEDSFISGSSRIGKNCIISCATVIGETVPDCSVLHCVKLKNGKFSARLYGVDDNPKKNELFGKKIPVPLWEYKIYPVREKATEAVKAVLAGETDGETISLRDGFEEADTASLIAWQESMRERICIGGLHDAVIEGVPVQKVREKYSYGFSDKWKSYLFDIAGRCDFSEKIRMYYYMSKLYEGETAFEAENRCFESVCRCVTENNRVKTVKEKLKIVKDEAEIRLPVRVNWGGGWSDTPPYCLEHGGNVLNAAVTFNGECPVKAVIRKTDEKKIILASEDNGSYCEFTDTQQLYDCRNPNDAFSIHKAALIVSGILPWEKQITMDELLEKTGSGFYMSTEVIDIPRGSGLGTSSILSAACIKAIYEFFGESIDESDVCSSVLCMEQIMSTGGGWQDQVGGLARGIKMISSDAGARQNVTCKNVRISEKALRELEDRFCLIYTGQRRLARNLLREVAGKYIGNDSSTLEVMYEIQRVAVLMRFELEKGNIDGFAKLLNRHWELSKKLDSGCTNTCIEQMFVACEDLIDGRMICGAGGGGFLQVILKKDVTPQMLSERLSSVFADSGAEVRNCKFYM